MKSVHFTIGDDEKQLIYSFFDKFAFAGDNLVSFDVTLTLLKAHVYELEAKIHFRWGVHSVIKVESYDVVQGIYMLFEKARLKVHKEAEKKKAH